MVDFLGRTDSVSSRDVKPRGVTKPDTAKAVEGKRKSKDREQDSNGNQQPRAQVTSPHADNERDVTDVSLNAIRVSSLAQLDSLEHRLSVLTAARDLEDILPAEDKTDSAPTTPPISDKSAARHAAYAYQHASETRQGPPPSRRQQRESIRQEQQRLKRMIARIDALLASGIDHIAMEREDNFYDKIRDALNAIDTETP